MIVVPDAGPLIYLGGAGQLELLRLLYAEVVVPRVVFEEVVVAGAGLTGADEVARATWLRIDDAAPDPDLLLVLDRGEVTQPSRWFSTTSLRTPSMPRLSGSTWSCLPSSMTERSGVAVDGSEPARIQGL